jgi:hypothetical protein
MISRCDGKGKNPFIVNVITYSGHGITYDGDAIAVIPEYQSETDKMEIVFRFINFSEWARRFAEINNTLTIFILSMCRIYVDKFCKVKDYSMEEYHKVKDFSMEDDELPPELNMFKYLSSDAERRKNAPNAHHGYSVMLFGTSVGRLCVEGTLFNQFFSNYDKIKYEDGVNMGWELINRHFYEDQL